MELKDRAETCTTDDTKCGDENIPFINKGGCATESVLEMTKEVAGACTNVRADHSGVDEEMTTSLITGSETTEVVTDDGAGTLTDVRADKTCADGEMSTHFIPQRIGDTETDAVMSIYKVVSAEEDQHWKDALRSEATYTDTPIDRAGADKEYTIGEDETMLHSEAAYTDTPIDRAGAVNDYTIGEDEKMNSGATGSEVGMMIDKTGTRTYIPVDKNCEEEIATPIISQCSDAKESGVDNAIEDNLSAAQTQTTYKHKIHTDSDSSAEDEFSDALLEQE